MRRDFPSMMSGRADRIRGLGPSLEAGTGSRFKSPISPQPSRRCASKQGAHFRNDIAIGVGGNQILLDDRAGNCIGLLEPHR
jgi:hypothetical protein